MPKMTSVAGAVPVPPVLDCPAPQCLGCYTLLSNSLGGQMNCQEGADTTSTGGEAAMSCAFCKKSRDDVRYLLAGPGVNICDACVATSIDLIAEWDRGKTGPPTAGARLYRHFKALLKKGVPPPARMHCDLCRSPVAIADSIPIERRGRLCPECIAAVQVAALRRDRHERE